MNMINFYRCLFAAFLAFLPFGTTYAESRGSGRPVKKEIMVLSSVFQDSVARQRPESKTPVAGERTAQERDEQLRNQERRSIKQVPRSLPKLKPQPVGERIRIDQQPVKRPKQGYGPRGY